ncbi:DUF7427 family protein [Mycolicibacter algericus]|nr:hypothetical protein MALGJ_00840 [Mycolicibacter algericus]
MSPADRAWLTLAGGVLAWDMLGAETLSAAAGRYHQRRPWLTRVVVAHLAAHLLGVVPPVADPPHWLTRPKRSIRAVLPALSGA